MMKNTPMLNQLSIAMALLAASLLQAQEKPAAAINGVKGVKQEAGESVKKIEPPAVTLPPASITPPPPNTAQTVNKVDGVNTIQGVKALGQDAPPPPPPAAAGNAVEGVNKVEGIKATPPNAVQGVPPPPPAGTVSTIRAVQGVQGIIAPKQLNLEAALLMKEDGKGTPAGGGAEGGKGKAAAAALLSGPRGIVPAAPLPDGDGRAGFQEFEKLTAPGS